MVSNFKAKNYEDKRTQAGTTTLEQRREKGDLIHMYRIMAGKDDIPLGFRGWLTGMGN